MIEILDIIGVFVFAISGVLAAINKKLDLFGVFIIAFVTALGGGTLRDVLIGRTPVGWMQDLNYVYLIIAGYFIAIFFRNYLNKLRLSLFLFDTIGLGVFTLIGIEKGLEYGLHPVICIALGTITATFGGLIRDILCNEIPLLLRKGTIYATICIIGGVLFFILRKFNLQDSINELVTSLFIIAFRLAAVKYKMSLPVLTIKS
ncbi:trimeric intracellular cation channel family protein [Flavobacterium okayamense]|uniref:Membrane protein n=1 Tax=Flavobacterium okayamense TaxID=2830782 RepID=A0ABM7S7E8_9FLAO|nr:trimeric intracellular cation channel family protein [Flavobacterium okayamense]BCY28851.1 membrane protein [Flavobacterium okayamense]